MRDVVVDVLAVEDDEEDFFILREMLLEAGAAGLRLTREKTLQAALKRLEADDDIGVVLLDLTLPDSRGFDTFHTLHAMAPTLPIVVLSGLDDEDVALDTVKEGAQDYLVKGRISGDLLVHAVRYAIERQRMISELDRHLDALKTSERRVRRIIEKHADAMLIVGENNAIEFANPAAQCFFGAACEELLGVPFGIGLAAGETPTEIEIEQIASRKTVYGEMRVTDIEWERRRGYLVSIRDVTVRKRLDQELQRHREHLEDLVEDRTRELRQSNADLKTEIRERRQAELKLQEAVSRLQEHDKAKSRFVSNVSHELRTPLASVGYAIDNLLRGVVGPVPEAVQSYLKMIRGDLHRLAATVNDILDLSRIDERSIRLNRGTVSFGRLVHKIYDSLKVNADAKRCAMVLSMPPACGFLCCDAEKIGRAILNVIQNAIKYTGEGGTVEVALGIEPQAAGMVWMRVTDNGIGIPPEYLARVTERYFRVGEHIDGTGLGLSICKETVDLHGGTLAIESPPPGREKGTQVTLRLPAVPAPTVAIVNGGDAGAALATILREHGYGVAVHAVSENLLTGLTHQRPRALLVGVREACLDGPELIARVRASEDLQDLPMIAVVEGALDAVRHEILGGFKLPTLTPPWNAEEVINALERATAD